MKKKLSVFILGIAILGFIGIGFTQQIYRPVPVRVDFIIDPAGAANSAVTATVAAPTNNTRVFIDCYIISAVNGSAPAAGSYNITTTGLITNLTLPMARAAVANTVSIPWNTCIPNPGVIIPATDVNTAVTFTGNSGDANTTLRIQVYGHYGS